MIEIDTSVSYSGYIDQTCIAHPCNENYRRKNESNDEFRRLRCNLSIMNLSLAIHAAHSFVEFLCNIKLIVFRNKHNYEMLSLAR